MQVPEDTDAERIVIGALAITGESIPTIASIIAPEDFYLIHLGNAYRAALDPALTGIVGDRRRQHIADTARIPVDYLEQLAGETVFLRNGTPWARRVAAAARARRVMATAAQLYNELGEGIPVEDCGDLIDRLATEVTGDL